MIGKQIIRRLLSAGTPVTVYDLIFHPDELKAIRRDFPKTDLRHVKGDIRDRAKLRTAMTKDVVGVIHLAAVSRVLWCLENERDCTDVNVRGTQIVLEEFKGSWFIQASSREVYGKADNYPVPEDTPHQAANVYGQSKADAEVVITRHLAGIAERASAVSPQRPLDVIMLRLSNVYGSNFDHRERLIPAIMTQALAHRTIQIVGGDQDLDMVNIQDVVNAFGLAVNRLEERRKAKDHSASQAEVFNIGTSNSTSAIKLIRKILHLTNSSSPIQTLPGDNRFPDKYVGSTERAREVLGYQAQVSIDQGLHRLAIAYLTDTADYLYHKIGADCKPPRTFSLKDLLSLDGCSGTVAGDFGGEPRYAFLREANRFDPNQQKNLNDPPKYEWVDSDMPTTWEFEIKKFGKKQASVMLKGTARNTGKEWYFEAPDGHTTTKEFLAQVDDSTGYVSLTTASGAPVVTLNNGFDQRRRALDPASTNTFRFTPFCCPNREPGWPGFREDPLAAAILDERTSNKRAFDASQPKRLCQRLRDAQAIVRTRLDLLMAYPKPIDIPEASMPTGAPHDWRMRGRDVCTNLCDHPTVCLDTGDCACGQASCVPRLRFPFAPFANTPDLSYQPHLTVDWEKIETKNPGALVAQVERSSWQNVLRPGARRWLGRNPDWWPINVTRLPDEAQSDRDDNPDHYDRLQTESHGCYSADSVMERGAKALSKPIENDGRTLVFLPHWEYTLRFPPVYEWAKNALEHNIPKPFDTSRMIVPFTFDWGRCNTILHHLYHIRLHSSPNEALIRASSWQPMGDLNSPCYFMDQDVVIPARTCLQDKLRERFGQVSSVTPSRLRSVLTTFKGSPNGAGTSVRQKLQCDRPYKKIRGNLEGGNDLDVFWGRMKLYPDGSEADYMDTIGDTVFCPLPRGTTGWATRTIDVIYA
ncbi:hypothetical protein VHUM_03022 [Vanrija humicola]|uniref:NAD(P)-binding domain-containing protein n=1 Tax=Vanrija humicola TaxID=5417 RepID=A0A7D8UYL2_VANHU|nr:hypothetical protein VHUM_03022 [Vanrija humicola]